jgi:hypothetical protein
MRSLSYLFILILITIFLKSCGKIEKLPPEPHIEFKSFEIFDTIDILGNNAKGGRLKFHFEDGDGDLGLNAPNSGQADTSNLFLSLYRIKKGIAFPAAENDPLKPYNYRIPQMDRLGQNKILKGNISVTLLYLFYSVSDTIKYDFFIKDRSRNLSNTDSTCQIVLTVNGICNK